MSADLTQLTIAGLFKELAEVEQAIRACSPTLTFDGVHSTVNARLVDLAAREQQICDELARRRGSLRQQLDARFQPASAATGWRPGTARVGVDPGPVRSARAAP